ncbi:MAG: SIS domain-containing protein [bacterium]
MKGEHTIAEIFNQPEAWSKVLSDLAPRGEEIERFLRGAGAGEAVFAGCGSSYYLAQSAAANFTGISHLPSRAVMASEVFIFPDAIFAEEMKYLFVPISRSGTTSEIVLATKYVREKMRAPTLAVSCYEDSDLAKMGDLKLIARGAQEKSVVMTGSYTSMLLSIQLAASLLAEDEDALGELRRLPELGESLIEEYGDTAESIGRRGGISTLIYLGSGPYYGLANESALKAKEMSISHSEAYNCLEFRHGPKSIVDPETLITLFVSESGRGYEVDLLKEVKGLGAVTFAICERADDSIEEAADYLIELKSGLGDYARSILYLPFTQILGYHRALSKGLDPDNPRNLTQVVKL